MKSVIKGASYILAHTPDMVLHNGTTQTTERIVNPESEYLKELPNHLRSFDQALAYWPNQVYIGNKTPDELAEVPQPWYDKECDINARYGKFGQMMPQEEFLLLMQACDVFDLVKLDKDFVTDEGVTAFFENGKLLVGLTADQTTRYLPVRGDKALFAIEAAVRPEHYDYSRDLVGYGYRFSVRDGGKSYRELRFRVSRQVLELVDVTEGVENTLYYRDHFFFTSNDFHIFRIEAEPSCVSIWIDGSQYAVVDCPMIEGGVEFAMTDTRVSLYNLRVE